MRYLVVLFVSVILFVLCYSAVECANNGLAKPDPPGGDVAPYPGETKY